MTTFDEPMEVSDATLAFPAGALKRMPPMEDIPEEHSTDSKRWERRLWQDAFYLGLDDAKFITQPGIDGGTAWRHLQSIVGSFDPQHEHKEAALSYLTSLWFKAAWWKPKGHDSDESPNWSEASPS